MAVEIIKHLLAPSYHRTQVLFKKNKQYFVASTVIAPLVGLETLIFRANKKGKIKNWLEVGGGRMLSNADAIAKFDRENP